MTARLSSLRAACSRRRRWIIALALIVAARVALPLILRVMLASQASKALHARVDIGDVDLSLLWGGIALEDVAVRPIAARPVAAPASTEGPTPDAAAPVGDAPGVPADAVVDTPPVIAWKRFAVELRWLPLLQKTIRLRVVELDSPHVALDRLADGRINLLALIPASAGPPDATPAPVPETAPAEKSEWAFAIDRFVLRHGSLRFRDFTFQDSEPIDTNFEQIEVTDVALRPGFYGEPARLRLGLALDDGSFRLDARLTLREAGVALEADVEAQNLPLRRARLYVPRVGWSALEGRLDAALAYRFETGTQNEVRGTVTLHDVAVRVAGIEEPAVAWHSFTVRLDPADLVGRRVAIAAVELSGVSLLVRPTGGEFLPAAATEPRPRTDTADTGPGAAGQGTAADAGGTTSREAQPAAAPSEAPWHWSVSSVKVADSRVRLLGADPPLDVGVGVGMSDLADNADHLAQVQLALTVGSGTLNVDGALRTAPPGFAGTVRIADLSLPEIAQAAGLPTRELLQAVRLGSDLKIEAGLAGADGSALAPSDVRVGGTISLADVRLTTPAPQNLSVGAKSIDLALSELHAAGLLAPRAATDGTGTPLANELTAAGRLSVGDLRVASPAPQGFSAAARSIDVSLTELRAAGLPPRASTGDLQARGRVALTDFECTGADPKVFSLGARAFDLVITELNLPGLLSPATAGAATRPLRVALGELRLVGPNVRLTRTPDGMLLPKFSTASVADAPPPTPESAPAPTRRIEVALDAFRLTDGRVAMVDRTVQPFFDGGLTALAVEVRKVRWPELTIGNLHVSATGAEQGKIDVIGALSRDDGWFEVNADKIALLPFNPYATTFSSYSLAGGKASVTTKVSVAQGRYNASSWLTLHHLDVRSGAGESLFQQQFGIPLSMALALMRDTLGDIGLDIPVQVDAEGTKVGLGTVIRSALQRAIMGALTSPLKLFGAAFGDGKVVSLPPAAIAFRLGRAEPSTDGADLDQLAELLVSRPGIGVVLEPVVTAGDARWLREQALRAEWADEGMFAKLRGLPQRGARERIRSALDARADNKDGELDQDDAATLDTWLDERPPIPAEQLHALAEARLAHVEHALCDQHGIQADRITRREAPAEGSADAPSVRIEIGAAGAPAPAASP